MPRRKITCRNSSCRHWMQECDGCDRRIVIDEDGTCESKKTPGDYLTQERHYLLLHDPTGQNSIIVTGDEPHATKAQREFLYDWMMANGHALRAGMYLKD